MRTLIKLNRTDIIKEIGEEFKFKFNYYHFSMIFPLEDQIPYFTNDIEIQKENKKFINNFYDKYPDNKMENKIKFEKFHNKICFAKVDSFSRIDNMPIVEFDLDQISKMRNKKLNSILNG